MIADLWWKGKKDGKTNFVIEEVVVVHEDNQKGVMSRWTLIWKKIYVFVKVL